MEGGGSGNARTENCLLTGQRRCRGFREATRRKRGKNKGKEVGVGVARGVNGLSGGGSEWVGGRGWRWVD